MDVRQRYFVWLRDVVDVRPTDRNRLQLLQQMHETIFTWSVPNDDNRAADGVLLRDEFARYVLNVSDIPKELDGPCTFLEMLVALARRMAYVLEDFTRGDDTPIYFWELVKNMNLRPGHKYDNNTILNNVINRTYGEYGSGGLFPLHRPKKDQRRVELWYQMMNYINERYPQV